MSIEIQKNESVQKTEIFGLYKFEWPIYEDDRGEFQQILFFQDLQKLGVGFFPAQFSRSKSNGSVLRGIHAEPMNKIVAAIEGVGEGVVVDLRPNSPTFLKHQMFSWDRRNRFAIFIPEGCGNSICNVSNSELHYVYLQDLPYRGKDFPSILWNDHALNIPWSLSNPILSKRDTEAISVDEFLERRDEIINSYLED